MASGASGFEARQEVFDACHKLLNNVSHAYRDGLYTSVGEDIFPDKAVEGLAALVRGEQV